MYGNGQVGELSGLSGSLPAGLGGLSSLTYLDLKGNMLSGRLPDPLPTTLASARLAGNYLTGTIPASYGAPRQDNMCMVCTPGVHAWMSSRFEISCRASMVCAFSTCTLGSFASVGLALT